MFVGQDKRKKQPRQRTSNKAVSWGAPQCHKPSDGTGRVSELENAIRVKTIKSVSSTDVTQRESPKTATPSHRLRTPFLVEKRVVCQTVSPFKSPALLIESVQATWILFGNSKDDDGTFTPRICRSPPKKSKASSSVPCLRNGRIRRAQDAIGDRRFSTTNGRMSPS